jgi:teichuronic acid biosynthesis glycosyltransferase TuaG
MVNKVSVVIPNYNCADFIGQTIESVLGQTYTNWELLIADDQSTDASLEVIKKYVAQDSRIKLLINENREKNARGAASARNCALKHVSGEYVAFLDSDDLWHPTKLAEQLQFMTLQKVDFSYTWYDIIDEKNNTLDIWKPSFDSTTYFEHLRRPVIGTLTVMYRAALFGQRKFQVPIQKYFYEDSKFWLDLLKTTPKAYCLKKNLSAYRLRRSSTSANKLEALVFFWRTLKQEKISYVRRLFSFTYYLFFSFFYKYKQILNRRKVNGSKP